MGFELISRHFLLFFTLLTIKVCFLIASEASKRFMITIRKQLRADRCAKADEENRKKGRRRSKDYRKISLFQDVFECAEHRV